MVNLIWHIHHAAEPVERNQIEHFFFFLTLRYQSFFKSWEGLFTLARHVIKKNHLSGDKVEMFLVDKKNKNKNVPLKEP